MDTDRTGRRRWLGGLALAGALIMLIAGQTVLKGRLTGAAYILYWVPCFLLTGTAIVFAFLDARALRRRIHEQQRSLMESTLQDIATKERDKQRENSPR